MKRKLLIRLAAPLLAVLLLTGCKELLEDLLPSVTTDAPTSYTIEADGGTISLSFTASHDWTASVVSSGADDWLSVSPSSGAKGKGTVRITAKPSSHPDARSATVRITSSTATLDVDITQKQHDALLLKVSQTVFGAEGGSFSVEVQHNIEVRLKIEPAAASWIEAASTKGMSTSTYLFNVAPNSDYDERSGEIFFSDVSGSLSESVAILQLQKDVLLVDDDVLNAEADGGEYRILVGHNVEVSCTSDVDWIQYIPTKSYIQEWLTFFVDANPTIDERRGTILFSGQDAGGNTLKKQVEVIQAGSIPYVNVLTERIDVSSSGEVFFVEVDSNVLPSVSDVPDWIDFEGREEGTPLRYVFRAAQNAEAGERSGIIWLSYEESFASVTVWQKGVDESLGYAQAGVFAFQGIDWAYTAGVDQIYLSKTGQKGVFTLFSPASNRFFRIEGLPAAPEAGDVLPAKVTQNLTSEVNAFFSTTFTVEQTDGPFVKLRSDQGFSLVIKTR